MTEYQKAAFVPDDPSMKVKPKRMKLKVNFATLYCGVTCIILGLIYYYSFQFTSPLRFMISFTRIWPLLMIVLGLAFFKARSLKMFIVGLVITFLTVLTTLSTVLIPLDGIDVTNLQYAIAKNDTIDEVSMFIENPSGKLTVLGGASANNFVDTFYESNYATFKPELIEKESEYLIDLKQPDFASGVGHYHKNLTARISNDIPTNISIQGVAMSSVLDLSTVKLKDLKVSIKASDLNLTIGDRLDTSEVTIDSIASSVTVFYPADVGVEVVYDGTFSSTNFEGLEIDGGGEDGGVYRSKNFEESLLKSRLILNSTVSRVTIVQH